MRLSVATSIIASVIILSSCGAGENDPGVEYAPNMYHSVPYEPLKQITDESSGEWVNSQSDAEVGEYYNSNPNNPFGMTMREPVPNTVRRGAVLPYRIPKDSFALAERLLVNPLDSTESVVSEGKLLYTRFCGHCHGEDGLVAGKVGEVYAGVPSYASAAIKDKKEGHIYHVITYGKGRMLAHGSQMSVEERWKIVRYVQVLQKQ
ncbi:MAG: cytochrome c [Saprospiraceae bacterium]|nr:cytochrome c [Saprospiraceae bacterium]